MKKVKASCALSKFAARGFFSKKAPDVRDASAELLEAFGVNVHVRGLAIPSKTPCLVVANHLSYLDIPILSTLLPLRFVTSREVAADKATGFIAKLGHAIIVERRNYTTLLKDVDTMTECLKAGENVCLFPEATTSSGFMLPWKSSLVEAAVRAKVKVVPVALQYLEVNGEPLCQENHHLVYYYRGMEFGEHLNRLINKVNSVKVRVSILRAIEGKNRKEITEKARRAVAAEF